jgi:Na+-driven multidrug efflux pump
LRPTRAGIMTSARDAVPLFWRTVALRAVFVVAVAVAARMGDAELAAYYVTFTVWYLLALGMDALAIAGQALLGRHLGGGRSETARTVTWQIMRWGIGLGVILMLGLLAVRTWLPSIFGSDPLVMQLTAAALVIVACQQPLAGVVFTLDGVLLGAGDNRFLAWAALITLVATVPALALAGASGSVTGIWVALSLFLLMRALTLLWRVSGRAWLVLGAAR